MNTKNAFLKIQELGYPVSLVAKKIGCDPSTLTKWLKGTNNISNELEEKVKKELISLKEQWLMIEVE